MAIVFRNNKYNLTIDSKTIIGVMGNNYEEFLLSLKGDIYYLDKKISVSNKLVSSILDINNKMVLKLLKDFNLSEEIIHKKVNILSLSEQKLLKYILMVLSDKKIIIIDEPYLDLDLNNKKKVVLLINKLIKNNKTIIIGSNNSNVIYELCKKVLFIHQDNYYYNSVDIFNNKNILKKYDIDIPNLIEFVLLTKNKNVNIRYSKDIRDLIKDVYRNVS